MTVEHLDLTDYVAIAVDVTGLDVTTLIKASRLDLAASALHAPSAGIGDEDFSPDFVTRQRCSSCVWSRTILCSTATSARAGCRCER